MDYKVVTDQFAVAPQISPDNIEEIKSLGYKVVINNRPDEETPGQPGTDDIRSLCENAGLQYYHLPIQSGTLPVEAIDQTRDLLNKIEGPVFAYCRSGTRSITLWALSQIGHQPSDQVISAVEKAGYDLPFLHNYR